MRELMKHWLLCFFLCCTSVYPTLAQNPELNDGIGVFAAAEMRYECVGTDRYQVYLEVYAECGFFDGSLNNRDNYPITIQSQSLDVQFEDYVLKENESPGREGEVIKIFCQEQDSQCETKDEDSPRGLKKYVYTGTIDLSLWGKADDWVIYWARNNRSEVISTIGDRQPYHSEVKLDNTTSCNSSPRFGEEESAVSSIVTVCKGSEGTTIPLNIIEPGGSNYRYAITSPLKGLDDNMDYQSGVSPSQPLGQNSSVSLNGGSLEIVSEVAQDEFNGTFDLIVEQLNNQGEVVGSARKGFQVTSLACENEKPTMTGFDRTDEFSRVFCVGDTIDMNIYGSDPDANNVIFLRNISYNKTNPLSRTPLFITGSAYADTAVGRFYWVPTASDTGTITATVSLRDDDCPVEETSVQEYTFKVNPQPTFDLGEDIFWDCQPFTLAPEITSPSSNLTYEWKNWLPFTSEDPIQEQWDTVSLGFVPIGDEPSIDVDGPTRLYFKVTDEAGCYSEDLVRVIRSLEGFFTYYRYCVGNTTQIEDASFYRGSTGVRWEWEFEVNGTTERRSTSTFEYDFPEVGIYPAQLIVENDLGCIDTFPQPIQIVEEPMLAMSFDPLCSGHDNLFSDADLEDGVDLIDETAYAMGDGFGTITWGIRDINKPFNESVQARTQIWPDYIFPDSGRYEITQNLVSAAQCTGLLVDTITIIQRPQIQLLTTDTLYLDCNQPDTTFQAIFNPDFIGTAPYDYTEYDLDPITKDLVERAERIVNSSDDTLELDVNETGTYYFRVEDANGCDYYEEVFVVDPVQIDFGYDSLCSEGPVEFKDLSVSSNGARDIVSWEWDFGDPAQSTSSERDPVFTYAEQGDYEVVLTVTDAAGCVERDTLNVFYTFPEEVLRIEPDVLVNRICVSDTIVGYNYSLQTNPSLPYHINSIRWKFVTPVEDTIFTYTGFDVDPLKINKGLVQEYIFTDTTSQIDIISEMRYNVNGNNTLFPEGCFRSDTLSRDLIIKPLFTGDVVDNRVCIGDSGIFKFNRTANAEIPVKTAEWSFFNKEGLLVGSSNEIEPLLYIDSLVLERGEQTLFVKARFVDENECVFEPPVTFVDIDKVNAQPRWDFEREICAGEPQLFTLESDQGDVDYWEVAQNYVETLDSGAFIAPTLENPVVGMPTITFQEAGKYPVSVYLIKNVSILTEDPKICRSRLDDSITVWSIPEYGIEWDTVCSSFPVVFQNTSVIDEDYGEVIRYIWDFGDDQFATSLPGESVSHQYRYGGYYTVRLSAETTKGCNNSVGVFDSVYVRPTPEIDYDYDPALEAGITITFSDASELFGATPIRMTWDFGELGAFEYDTTGGVDVQDYQDVLWDEVGIYYIKHSVTTADGCTGVNDSIRIDLNTYLDLPTVFSPNGDGLNDGLSLIHKSIRELLTYKIYNRWGQVIFDAEGDINATWDGTYNGSPQEVGVYVVHVKAIGAYTTEFEFKKNVKLIR